MSRRIVSYDDISDEVPAPTTTQDENTCSNSVQSRSTGGIGKRKRKGEKVGKGKKSKPTRVLVHWDDPSYQPWQAGWGDDGGSYRDHQEDAGRVDGEESDEDGREFFDAIDGVDQEEDAVVCGEGKEEERYTDWKYDEFGEPYDETHAVQDQGPWLRRQDDPSAEYGIGEGEAYDPNQHCDEHEDDESNVYDDLDQDEYEEQESEDENLPFAIPSVAEFHRKYDATQAQLAPSAGSATYTGSVLQQQQHRPPVEVGGGGRTLTHAEIWGDLSLVHAYTAAMDQYCSFHKLACADAEEQDEVKSALWTDAPRYDSLLAHQVKEDTLQILAQPRTSPTNTTENTAIHATTTQSNTGTEKEKEKPSQHRGKQIVTPVPHAHLQGNSAWKKAVKTVQTTPNSIGLSSTPLAQSSTKPHSGQPPEQETQAQLQTESELHSYWYAGYYAGLAAATTDETTTDETTAPTTNPSSLHKR